MDIITEAQGKKKTESVRGTSPQRVMHPASSVSIPLARGIRSGRDNDTGRVDGSRNKKKVLNWPLISERMREREKGFCGFFHVIICLPHMFMT